MISLFGKNKYKWILLFSLCIYVGYIFFEQQVFMGNYEHQQAYYASEIEKAQSETERLNKLRDMCATEYFIEKIAREKLGMVKPNEMVYIDASR